MNRLLPHRTIHRLRRKPSSLVITSVKIPRALDKALKAEARKADRSLSWVIREALQGYVTFRAARPAEALAKAEQGRPE
jgi:predicted transcriptional regulator